MGNKALIMGGSGFLGTAITERLLRDGWSADVLSRGNKPVLPGCGVLQADRSDLGWLRAALEGREYDLVVDCAAYRGLDVENALLSLSGRCGHYVFISTDYVYASSTVTAYPIQESAATHRETPYAAGKLDCEEMLLAAWKESGFPVTVLRPPHILGAGKELGSDQVLGRDPELLNIIRGGSELRLLSEGQLIIQPVWTREIAQCISHLAGMEGSFGQIFNLVGPDAVTAKRYYEIVAGLLGVDLRFESVPVGTFVQARPLDLHNARHRLYDTSSLTKITGYKPSLRLEDAIQETFEWMLARDRPSREQ